jgi:hypothetical protein
LSLQKAIVSRLSAIEELAGVRQLFEQGLLPLSDRACQTLR